MLSVVFLVAACTMPSSSPNVTPAATVETSSTESTICAVAADLRHAQEVHVQPYSDLVVKWIISTDEVPQSVKDEAKMHLIGILADLNKNASNFLDVRSPEYASLIVDLQHAYVGYGTAAMGLLKMSEAGGSPLEDLSPAAIDLAQSMADGTSSLLSAQSAMEMLDASGSLICAG